MAHLHSVYDSDTHFSINAVTRKISDTTKNLVQGDHNSERFTFVLPRLVEGHDMSQCDKIEIHYLNVSNDKTNQSKDVYPVKDMRINPADDDNVIFSWLISGNATKYAGSLNFLICFTCLDGTDIAYAWNTEIFKGITVSEGMNNGEPVIVEYSDVLEAWKREILEAFDAEFDIVQDTGNSEAKVMSQKAVTDSLGKLSQKISPTTVFDWTTRKKTSQTGWVAGFYASGDSTPSIDTSATFIRTEMFIPVTGYDKLTVIPPAGYAVEVVAIKEDKTFEWCGHANNSSHPENTNTAVEVILTGVVSVGVTVGRFANADGDVYAADSDFCAGVVMTLTRSCSIEKGERAHYELFTGRYDWDDLSRDEAPCGWVTGYYSTTENKIISGTNFICTANKIPLNNVKSITATPPLGYSLEINAFKGDGTCDIIGNANSNKAPHYIDVPWTLEAGEYKSISITVGNLGGTALTKKNDKTFIDGAVLMVTYDTPINDEPRDYFKEEIAATINSVHEILTEPCLVFPLITDIHYKSDSEHPAVFDTSVKNMHKVVGNIPCDFVLDLGDNVGGYTSQDETIRRVRHIMAQFRTLNLPLYSVIGNHDTNIYKTGEMFTTAQMYGNYVSSTKDVVYNHATCGTDYYKDFDALNIRLVVLNGSNGDRYKYSSDTVDWFRNVALNTDKMILLAVHYSIISTQNYNHTGDATNGGAMADAVSAFIAGGGTIIQLCGHSHVDYAYTTPWLTVYSACAMFEHTDLTATGYTKIQGYTGELVAPSREVGTATEDCWNVVVVRPTERKINFIRFGAGEDREFAF